MTTNQFKKKNYNKTIISWLVSLHIDTDKTKVITTCHTLTTCIKTISSTRTILHMAYTIFRNHSTLKVNSQLLNSRHNKSGGKRRQFVTSFSARAKLPGPVQYIIICGWSEFMLNATNITETVSSQLSRAEIYEGFMIHTPRRALQIILHMFW